MEGLKYKDSKEREVQACSERRAARQDNDALQRALIAQLYSVANLSQWGPNANEEFVVVELKDQRDLAGVLLLFHYYDSLSRYPGLHECSALLPGSHVCRLLIALTLVIDTLVKVYSYARPKETGECPWRIPHGASWQHKSCTYVCCIQQDDWAPAAPLREGQSPSRRRDMSVEAHAVVDEEMPGALPRHLCRD